MHQPRWTWALARSMLVLTGTNGKIRCCCQPRRSHSFYGSHGFRFATAERSPADHFGRRGPNSTLASRLDSCAPCVFLILSSGFQGVPYLGSVPGLLRYCRRFVWSARALPSRHGSLSALSSVTDRFRHRRLSWIVLQHKSYSILAALSLGCDTRGGLFAALLICLMWARCSRGIHHTRRGLFLVLLTRLTWARCSRGIYHTWRGLFAALLTRLTSACCSRGIRHTRCGLFAALLICLTWARCSHGIHHARRGLLLALLTRLTWARCSRGIYHAWRGLFVALLTRLTSACCSRGILHTRRGLFAALLTCLAWARCSWGVVVAAPVTGIER